MPPLLNRHNWRSALNLFRCIANPLSFLLLLLTPVERAVVKVRTPIGLVRLRIRNRESAKTIFSVFCRHDYLLPADARYQFLDLGANIGVAAAYFLSRNEHNRVLGVEPDPHNLPFLRENMAQFGERFELLPVAVHTNDGSIDFYCAADGKYSTTCVPRDVRGWRKIGVSSVSFSGLCDAVLRCAGPLSVAIKIDVEGLEE